MKKLFALCMIVCLVFAITGCTKTSDINDTPSPQSPINGDENGDINQDVNNITGTTGVTGTTGTTGTTGITNGTGTSGISGAGTYLTSIRDTDGTLRRAITDMDTTTINTSDKDYLSKTGDYYRRKAAAYRAALNSINGVNVDTANRTYNDSITSYYQNGYDTYNNLATKYGTFKTTNDETTYRSGLGKAAYDIKTDLRTGYDRAIEALGIGTTTNNNTTTNGTTNTTNR